MAHGCKTRGHVAFAEAIAPARDDECPLLGVKRTLRGRAIDHYVASRLLGLPKLVQ
jgi:hypothetical protein